MVYYFSYILKIKIKPKSYLALGSSFHKTAENNYVQKIETHEDLPEQDLCGIFSSEFDTYKDGTDWEEGEKPGEVKDMGVNIVKIYRNIVSPVIQPKYVEHSCDVEFKDLPILNEKGDQVGSEPFPFTYKAVIDLIDDKDIVIDHKILGKRKSLMDVRTDMQLTSYALAHRMMFGKKESGLRFDCMIKNKTPLYDPCVTTRTEGEIAGLLKLMTYVYDLIQNEIFYPNTDNTYCSPGGCGYWDMCQKKWWDRDKKDFAEVTEALEAKADEKKKKAEEKKALAEEKQLAKLEKGNSGKKVVQPILDEILSNSVRNVSEQLHSEDVKSAPKESLVLEPTIKKKRGRPKNGLK